MQLFRIPVIKLLGIYKMKKTNEAIDKHVRDLRTEKLKYAIPITLAFVIIMGYAIRNHFSPIVNKEIITGVVESLHQGQSITGSDLDHFFIRLDDNQVLKVSIASGKGIPFRQNARAEIEITVKESGPTQYKFKRYVN